MRGFPVADWPVVICCHAVTLDAQYQTSGTMIDLPNAQIKINPSRSVRHYMIVRFGARIGL